MFDLFPDNIDHVKCTREGGGCETTMPWYMVNEIKLATEHWFTVIGRLIIDLLPEYMSSDQWMILSLGRFGKGGSIIIIQPVVNFWNYFKFNDKSGWH